MVWLFGKHGHGARTVGGDGAPVCYGALECEGRSDGAAGAGVGAGDAIDLDALKWDINCMSMP